MSKKNNTQNWLQRFHATMNTNNRHFLFVAGPCVINTYEETELILQSLLTILKPFHEKKIIFVFKASFEKANRTKLTSFQGPGLDKGLEILSILKKKYNIPLLSDIHCINHIKQTSKILDILQIPAFLSRQTELIVQAGQTKLHINIKKGQFISPNETKYITEKIKASSGNQKVWMTERGSSFGYNNLVNDFRCIPIMRRHAPWVLYDATHSLQTPGLNNPIEQRFLLPNLTYAAVSSGCDGLYMEVHPKPEESRSDRFTVYPLSNLSILLFKALQIFQLNLHDESTFGIKRLKIQSLPIKKT